MDQDQNNIIKVVKGDTYVRSVKIFWRDERKDLYEYKFQETDVIILKVYDSEYKMILTHQYEVVNGQIEIRIPLDIPEGIYNYKLTLKQESGAVYTCEHSYVYIRKE